MHGQYFFIINILLQPLLFHGKYLFYGCKLFDGQYFFHNQNFFHSQYICHSHYFFMATIFSCMLNNSVTKLVHQATGSLVSLLDGVSCLFCFFVLGHYCPYPITRLFWLSLVFMAILLVIGNDFVRANNFVMAINLVG